MSKGKSHKFWKNIHQLSVAQDKKKGGLCVSEWILQDHFKPIVHGHCVCNALLKKQEYHYMNVKTGKHIVVGSACRSNHGFQDLGKRKKKGKGNIIGPNHLKPVEYEIIENFVGCEDNRKNNSIFCP